MTRHTGIASGLRRRRRLLAGLALACILLALSSTAPAQTLLNITKGKPEAAAPEKEKTPGEAIADLRKDLDEAREALSIAREAPESASPAALGATAEETQKKLSLLYERVHLYEQHIAAYKSLRETRGANKDLTAEIESWTGFEQPPPYPITLVDELRDDIHAQNLKIKNEEVKQSIARDDPEDARELYESAGQKLRKAEEDRETPSGAADEVRLGWLYSLAQLENSVAEAKMLAAETQQRTLQETLAHHSQNLTFLERKLRVAIANAPFTREELDEKLAAIAAAREFIQGELNKTFRNDRDSRRAREKARKALAAAGERATLDEPAAEELERLERIVEVRQAWVETTSQILEGLKVGLQQFDTEVMVWESRYRLKRVTDDNELKEFLDEADKRLEKLRGYQSFFESNLELTKGLVINQQTRLSALPSEGADKELADQLNEAYVTRAVFFGRGLVRVGEMIRLLENWRDEIAERRDSVPLSERLRAFGATAFKVAMNVWNYEIFVAEDTIIVDGQAITQRRPVTISKVVRALLILALGLWLSSVVARRIRILSAKYFKVEQNVAGMIEKVFRAFIVTSVVLFALVTVKIPFTIFAFMGGALAIGVGFGAQNLINNLVSGIILLLERPIKVGDIVEIDGTRGQVKSIGARCSQVRCFDGIDILVPNSSFLEKNVINWTLSDRLLRLSISVGVAYGSPTREVSSLIGDVVNEHDRVLKIPAPTVLFEDFGDDALIFTVFFWIEITSQMDFRIVASDLRHMLDERLSMAGITIAFPQRDVHLDQPAPIQVRILKDRPIGGAEEASD